LSVLSRQPSGISDALLRPAGPGRAQVGNLGPICKQRGDVPEARRLWQQAVELCRRIGMPHMVAKVQGWIDALPPEDGPQ